MITQVGPRTNNNTVSLAYVVGTDDITTVSVWPAGGAKIEDGSRARGVSSDGLLVKEIRVRIQDKWALVASRA